MINNIVVGCDFIIVVTEETLLEWLWQLEIERAVYEVKHGLQGKPLSSL
jgi:hypothetical protein